MNEFAADLDALIELHRQRGDLTDTDIIEILDAAADSVADDDD